MNDKDFDEIHDYDYNKGFEEADITSNEIFSDSNTQEPLSDEPEVNNSRSLFSSNNAGSTPNVIDGEVAADMMRENVSNTLSLEELKAQQNFPMGLLGGLLASVLCIMLWALITVLTEYQITYMAIGVGLAVGFSIQKLGKGITPIYGIMGAVLSLLTCFVGNLISSVCFIAAELNISYLQAFSGLNGDIIISIVKETFREIDLFFYGMAIYTGYVCSIKSDSN